MQTRLPTIALGATFFALGFVLAIVLSTPTNPRTAAIGAEAAELCKREKLHRVVYAAGAERLATILENLRGEPSLDAEIARVLELTKD